MVPIFSEQSWTPRVLDLRENPRLTFIGKGALSLPGLEILRLPGNLAFMDETSVTSKTLQSIEYEEAIVGTGAGEEDTRRNFITDDTDFFPSICCGIGKAISLTQDEMISFCDLGRNQPGVDAALEYGVSYKEATIVEIIDGSSVFLSEAVESPFKCAEVCHVYKG